MVSWTATDGASPAIGDALTTDLYQFLRTVDEYPPEHLFLLKDVHLSLSDPHVIRRVKDLLPQLIAKRQTLMCVGAVEKIPIEWIKDVTLIDLPLPSLEEMQEELTQLVSQQFAHLTLDGRQEEHMAKAVLGLTGREARKAFARALHGRDVVDENVYATLVAEKRHMVQGPTCWSSSISKRESETSAGSKGSKTGSSSGPKRSARMPALAASPTPRESCSPVSRDAVRASRPRRSPGF